MWTQQLMNRMFLNLPAQISPGLPDYTVPVSTSVMRASRAEIKRLVAPFQSRLDKKCVNITLQFTFKTIILLFQTIIFISLF